MDRFIFLDEKEIQYISHVLENWDTEKIDILDENIFVDDKFVEGIRKYGSDNKLFRGFLWIGEKLTFVKIDHVRDNEVKEI